MSKALMTCALCGHQFAPEKHQACVSCPVQSNCNIICCPECGFSDVDPSGSKVVKWLTAKYSRKRREK